MGLLKRAMWKESRGDSTVEFARFIEAARKGDVQAVRDAAARGIDIDATGTYNDTPTALMQAAGEGKLEVVKTLVGELSADQYVTDDRGANCLHYAAEGGHPKVVGWLLDEGGMDIGALDGRGELATHHAARNAHSSVLEMLRNRSPRLVNMRSNRGVTPLMLLSEATGDPRLVAQLIKYGALVNATDDNGETALMYAARMDHFKVCSELIIKHKADAQKKNAAGKTAMGIAKDYGGMRSVDVLANGGVLQNGAREQKSALSSEKKNVSQAGHSKKDGSTKKRKATMDAKQVPSAKKVASLQKDRKIPDGVSMKMVRMFEKMGPQRRPSKCRVCRTCKNASLKKACLLMREYFRDSVQNSRKASKSGGNSSSLENGPTLPKEPTVAVDDDENFFVAAEDGDIATIRRMLDGGFNVNAKDDEDGSTALMFAALKGRRDLIEELILQGADEKITDKYGTTVLMCAAQEGHHKLIAHLCSRPDADVRGSEESGSRGRLRAETAEARKTRQHSMDPNVANVDGDTALHFAAQGGHHKAVDVLLSCMADPSVKNKDGETAEMVAESTGHKAVARRLREAVRQEKAIEPAHESVPVKVKSSGAKRNAKKAPAEAKQGQGISCRKDTQLVTPSNVDCVHALDTINETSARNVSLTRNEKDFLMAIKLGNQADARRLVIESGVSVEISNSDGTTALMIICMDGDKSMFDFLVKDLKADPKAADVFGMTVLMHAAQEGQKELAEDLLGTYGVDIDAHTKDGDTALMYAAQGGHVDTVKLLLRHGAAVDAEDNVGRTPLMLAAEGGHLDAVEYLMKKGAKVKPDWLVDLATTKKR